MDLSASCEDHGREGDIVHRKVKECETCIYPILEEQARQLSAFVNFKNCQTQTVADPEILILNRGHEKII